MKISKLLVLIASCLFLFACSPKTTATTISFDQKTAVQNQLYVSDEKIADNTVIYLQSSDAGVNLLLPSFTVYSKFYTNVGGEAIKHNNKIAVPSESVILMLTEPVTLPFGGVATPEPSPTPIPAGTFVFHDSYQSNGQTIYVDDFYGHCTKSFGYGLPEQGGKFNQWYTVENGVAIRHEGEISLQADGYQYSENGWPFTVK